MSLSAAYVALLTGVLVWTVLVRKLRAEPWKPLTAGETQALDDVRMPAAKTGLWIFLAVISSLFALFMTAYSMRMGHGHGEDMHDWHPVTEPGVLWLNSGVLVLGSIAMQWARVSIAKGNRSRAQESLLIGGLLTVAFLVGQLFAWSELQTSVEITARNPALAFFYVLTAVHGLHLIGGLVVWAKTLLRLRRQETELIDVRLSVELCAVYWHYLLLVWLVLFTLLLAT
jgi:cytochrome c oxidase subunit 3